jgi:hypothetical protein
MRELKFITCLPDDTYYTWQVHLWLESLKKLNKSKDAVILIFTPITRETNRSKWEKIVNLYPEATFRFYRDDKDEVSRKLIPIYIPIIRPWLMIQWFKEHPEYSEHAIFYCDSDILFTEDFNVDEFVQDDVNYLSDTNSYIGVQYFDNKVRDVIEDRREEYESMDVLAMMGSLVGITREQAEENKEHSGGAQYLLKNLNARFWEKVQRDCIIIRSYLQSINKEFFENESKGFQSWCADMWAVLWNLWFYETDVKVIKEMDFAWSTDPITKLESTTILHNAGIVSPWMAKQPYFYKGKYHQGLDPTTDPHLTKVLESEHTKTKCNWYYANALKELKQKYNINY